MHFSVIVPSFNVERYIDECVRSAARQQHAGEHEVLVVDDGSTDATPAILRRLAAELPNVRVWFQANDGAPGKARNRGIAEASGEYLVFLDADDRLPADALARLREAASGDPCVIAGARDVIDERSAIVGRRALPPGLLGDIALTGRLQLRHRALYLNAHGKAFRRALVVGNDVRFTEGHPGQDTAFALGVFACARSVRGIAASVYDLRIRGDAANPSLTQQFDPRVVERRLASARQCLVDLEARGHAQFAADARAYLLLGLLKRVCDERRRGPIARLDAIRRSLRAFLQEGRDAGALARMSGDFRRRWLAAAAMLAVPGAFRAAIAVLARSGAG